MTDTERRNGMDDVLTALAEIKTSLNSNNEMTSKMHHVIYENGLVSKVAVNSSSIKRLWWFVGPLVFGFIGLGFCLYKSVLAMGG